MDDWYKDIDEFDERPDEYEFDEFDGRPDEHKIDEFDDVPEEYKIDEFDEMMDEHVDQPKIDPESPELGRRKDLA